MNINEVYRDIDGKLLRIISQHENGKQIAIIYLYTEDAVPLWIDIDEFNNKLENKVLKLTDDPYLRIISDSDLKEKDKEKRDKLYSIIYPVWEKSKDSLLNKRTRAQVYKEVAYYNGFSFSSARKYFSKFWQKGMTKNSLLDEKDLCGKYDRREISVEQKLGRPRQPNSFADIDEGMNVDSRTKDKIKLMALTKYPKVNRPSKVHVYREMLRLYFSDKKINSDGSINYIIWDESRIPTVEQFYYWFNKYCDPRLNIQKRLGETFYERNKRAKTANTVYDSNGPCDRFEIDSTISDIFLLSSRYKNKLIGRPVLYFIVDTFTRMVCGMYVGLEGPSWMGAAMALNNMITNKKEFCKFNGIDIGEDIWPAHHVPTTLLADNAEMVSNNVADLESIFGIHITYTPSYRSDLKGVVERTFGKFNGPTRMQAPGAVMKEFRERGSRNTQFDAALTLDDYAQFIINIIIEQNQTTMKNYPYTQEMALAGINLTPIDLWNWGMQYKKGLSKTITNENQFRMALLPKASSTITAQGVSFKGLFYESERFLQEAWHLRKNKTIKIAYDPRIVDNIYVINSKDLMDFDILNLTRPYEAYKGWSFDEYWFSEQLMRERTRAVKHSDLQRQIDTITKNLVISKGAKLKKRNYPKILSKSSYLGGIRANRALEKHLNRQAEAFRFEDFKEPLKNDEEPEKKTRNALSVFDFMEGEKDE